MKFFQLLSLALLMGTLGSACDRQTVTPDPFEDHLPLATTALTDLGLTATLYSHDSLVAGYEQLFVVLRDAEDKVVSADWELTLHPLMYMPGHTHSAPAEQAGEANADGALHGAVVFIMPSTADSRWEIKIHLHNGATDEHADWVVPVSVASPAEARVRSFIAPDDSSKLFVSLVQPKNPAVGMNDFELAIHRKATMMDFPAVEGLTVEIDPTMPSMGHGSPNNVHPTATGNGHYAGKVNFTMDGWWQVAVVIRRNGQVIGTTEMNITFAVR